LPTERYRGAEVTVGSAVADGTGVAVGRTGAVVAVTTGIGVDDGKGGRVADGVALALASVGARDVATIAVPVRLGVGNVNAVGALEADKLQAMAIPENKSAKSK